MELLVDFWAQFKVLVLTYRGLTKLGPGCLKDWLLPYDTSYGTFLKFSAPGPSAIWNMYGGQLLGTGPFHQWHQTCGNFFIRLYMLCFGFYIPSEAYVFPEDPWGHLSWRGFLWVAVFIG